MAQDLTEAGTADCPMLNIHLTGQKDKDALETWETANATIAAWSEDGYMQTFKMTFDALYFAAANAAAGEGTVAWGVSCATTGVVDGYGCYAVNMQWAASAGVSYTPEQYVTMVYIGGSLTTTNLDSTQASVTSITAANTHVAKYGFVQGTTWDGSTAITAAGGVQSVAVYMPTADKKADGEDTTTGDRLDKGDKLNGLGAVGASASVPSAACFTEEKLELGAATLAVAGTAALAVALSI